jgi:hypothetical protein
MSAAVAAAAARRHARRRPRPRAAATPTTPMSAAASRRRPRDRPAAAPPRPTPDAALMAPCLLPTAHRSLPTIFQNNPFSLKEISVSRHLLLNLGESQSVGNRKQQIPQVV